jgi:hypothetical protein
VLVALVVALADAAVETAGTVALIVATEPSTRAVSAAPPQPTNTTSAPASAPIGNRIGASKRA